MRALAWPLRILAWALMFIPMFFVWFPGGVLLRLADKLDAQ